MHQTLSMPSSWVHASPFHPSIPDGTLRMAAALLSSLGAAMQALFRRRIDQENVHLERTAIASQNPQKTLTLFIDVCKATS